MDESDDDDSFGPRSLSDSLFDVGTLWNSFAICCAGRTGAVTLLAFWVRSPEANETPPFSSFLPELAAIDDDVNVKGVGEEVREADDAIAREQEGPRGSRQETSQIRLITCVRQMAFTGGLKIITSGEPR